MKHSNLKLAQMLTPVSVQVQPRDFGDLPYVGLEHIRSGDIVMREVASPREVRSTKWAFQTGDILYGKLRPYLNKCVVADRDGICSTDILVLRPQPDVNAKYVAYAMSNGTFVDFANSTTSGMNLPRTTWSKVNGYEVAVPVDTKGKLDLAEQKRVANEIDQAFLIKRSAIVDVEKTGALFSAVSRLQFQEIENARNVTLGEICNITKGNSPTMKTKAGEFPFVVTAAERKTADTYQFDDEAVCISLVSSTGHGHKSIHRLHYQDGRFALANIMVALTAKDKSELLVKYLYHYLTFYRNELLLPLMRGVANVTIPFASVAGVQVRFPDIEEQKRVVAIFDQAELLKRKLDSRNRHVHQLTRSVLHQSFAPLT